LKSSVDDLNNDLGIDFHPDFPGLDSFYTIQTDIAQAVKIDVRVTNFGFNNAVVPPTTVGSSPPPPRWYSVALIEEENGVEVDRVEHRVFAARIAQINSMATNNYYQDFSFFWLPSRLGKVTLYAKVDLETIETRVVVNADSNPRNNRTRAITVEVGEPNKPEKPVRYVGTPNSQAISHTMPFNFMLKTILEINMV
jgi:hypothetical protein